MAPVRFCLLLLLFVPIISTASSTLDAAVPLAALADLPSFVYYQFGRNISYQQNICIGSSSNCSVFADSKGPCREGEWYVYNRRDALRTKGSFEPVCQPPPCPPGYSLLLPDKKCYHDVDIDETICSGGQSPDMNLFGETFCSCGYWAATLLSSGKKECHNLLTQGPCDRESLFVPVNDLMNFGQGQCVSSSCAKLVKPRINIAEIRLPNGRTDCFQLFSQGPCGEKYRLRLVSLSEFPGVSLLSCVLNSPVGGMVAVTHSETKSVKCVVNDKGECVLPLKNKPVEPHPLYLEES